MTSQHDCIDCAGLPPDDRPQRPRPAIHGGPKSRRCDTHQRAHARDVRTRRAVARVARVYGIDEAEQAELWAFQGERCACGRKPSRRPDTDHDHRCCNGPTSCGKCVRGLLCRACNTYVIGRYSAAQLRALVEYLEDPPAARLRRSRNEAA